MKIKKLTFLWLSALLLCGVVQAGQEIDDASRLNATAVSEVVDVRTENDVRMALAKARSNHRHVSIAGKRHSMGGQTFDQDNIVLNMLPFHAIDYDGSSQLLTVQSGASWHEVQMFLDPKGRSVWVMQSDNIFSVGGTLSVNAHGWQPRQGPVASTVESFHLMLASGEIRNCSRTENSELFHAALGGYGLLGVILDVRLRTVPNKLYHQMSYFLPSAVYAATFQKEVEKHSDVELAYGRLSLDKRHFLTEAGLHLFKPVDPQPARLPSMQQERMVKLKSSVFRRSAKSDSGKRNRWIMEKDLARYQEQHPITRNSVMSPDFRVVWHPMPDTRDILQEYFVPYAKLNDFIEDLRAGIQKSDINLLNVTLRDVKKDDDTVLAYAKTDVCALVLFFSQPPTPEAEETMRHFTQTLIDQTVAMDGSFYLPYRLNYRVDQFRKAYPKAQEFLKIKHHYDPDGLFTSQFFHYAFESKP